MKLMLKRDDASQKVVGLYSGVGKDSSYRISVEVLMYFPV